MPIKIQMLKIKIFIDIIDAVFILLILLKCQQLLAFFNICEQGEVRAQLKLV